MSWPFVLGSTLMGQQQQAEGQQQSQQQSAANSLAQSIAGIGGSAQAQAGNPMEALFAQLTQGMMSGPPGSTPFGGGLPNV